MTASSAAAWNWLDRAAIGLVPVAAGLAVALTLLGPGRERPAVGARVYGLPLEGASPWALRIETLRSERGRLAAAAELPLQVALHRGATRAALWTGRSGSSGIAEVTLDTGAVVPSSAQAPPWQLEIRSADAVLAAGDIVPGAPPRAVREPPLEGTVEGPVELEVSLPRAVAVASLPERITVTAKLPSSHEGVGGERCDGDARAPEGPAGDDYLLELAARGAAVSPPAPASEWQCVAGHWRLGWSATLVAQAPPVELEVLVKTTDGARSHWRGEVPVVLGWPWAEERAAGAGRLLVRSVSAAPELYASVVGPGGRLWGQRLTLAPDAEGLTRLEQALPTMPPGPLVLRLSSDPAEPSATTARWPLRPALGSLDGTELRVLLDGLPAARDREARRQTGARLPTVSFIAASGLFELAYLLRRHRLGRERALQSLTAAESSARKRAQMVAEFGLLWIGVLGGGVALAFVALAALAFWG